MKPETSEKTKNLRKNTKRALFRRRRAGMPSGSAGGNTGQRRRREGRMDNLGNPLGLPAGIHRGCCGDRKGRSAYSLLGPSWDLVGHSQQAKTLGANFESNTTTKEVVYYPDVFGARDTSFVSPLLRSAPLMREWDGWRFSPIVCLWGSISLYVGVPYGLSSKINRFRRHWCWVKGPGITLNPGWRKPLAKQDIPLLDDEVGLKTHIRRLIKDGVICEVKERLTPIFKRLLGLKTVNVPVDASSSSPESSGSYSTSESFSTPGIPLKILPLEGSWDILSGVDDESHEIFVDIMPPVGEAMSHCLRPTRGTAVPPLRGRVLPNAEEGEGFHEEEVRKRIGEITPPRRAEKLLGIDDPPPPTVTKTTKTPKKLAGFAAHNQPGEKEVFETRHSPEPTGPTRRRKRLAGNYEGCVPDSKCLGPLHHSSGPIPKISNFPDPRTGVMLFEDNARRGSAVATSSQADLNHYMASKRNTRRNG
ncbi:hypothetical protein Droror1_Dr00028231 [Drosera rotundifolia]